MDQYHTILSLAAGDTLVGRYQLIQSLGRGAMGEVWKAQDIELNAVVAVKLLPPEFAGSSSADQRMKAEAKLGRSLSHEAVVRLFDYQRDPSRQNVSFLVMEYVQGRTLADLVDEDGPQPLERVLGWAGDLAAGIDYAHGQKVLHRDIKPGNIMIQRVTGKAKVLDFGIGREIRNTMSQVSMRGDLSGTPAYMSPQQLMGENDPSNDIYSLAASLYHALAGKPPFTDGHLQTQIMYKPVAPIAGVPEHVNEALASGLAKRANQRPANAAQLARAMLHLARPLPSRVLVETPPERTEAVQRDVVHQRAIVRTPTAAVVSSPRRSIGLLGAFWIVAAVIALIGVSVVLYQESKRRSAQQDAAVARQHEAARAAEEERFAQARAAEEARQREAARLAEERRLAQARAAEEARQREAARLTAIGSRHLERKSIELDFGVIVEFVYIDAPAVAPDGFLMGSPPDEEGRVHDEVPHRVKLTRGFWMQTTEVTQEQWQAVMVKNPSHFKGRAGFPVDHVSWDDCLEFIGKLRQRGIGARLPTEAEWEFACRAGTTTPFSFGGTISTEQANYNPDSNSTYGNGPEGKYRQRTTPVGTFPPNAWGLHDMHGNVWEWCQDQYGAYPSSTVTDPTGPQTGSDRVLRGGAWNSGPVRSAYRLMASPSNRDWYTAGLRLCLNAD